jgi:hypothetical protein
MSKKRKTTTTDPIYELPEEGDLFIYQTIENGSGVRQYILPTSVFPSQELLDYALEKVILSPEEVDEEGDLEDKAITALNAAEQANESKGLKVPPMTNAEVRKKRARIVGLIGIEYC